jgi:hypothetical protein
MTPATVRDEKENEDGEGPDHRRGVHLGNSLQERPEDQCPSMETETIF